MTTLLFYLFLAISFQYVIGQNCYKDIGCFPQTKPWSSISRPFPKPMPPDKINVKLYFYTRKYPKRFNVSVYPDIEMNGSDFDSSRASTVFITHGFASSGNETWLSDMKDAYLSDVDANIFLVDWGKGASLLNYLQVASNTRVVGAILARFINHLIDLGQNQTKVHLIGHSLGAHISGYAAKIVNNRTQSNNTSQSTNSTKIGRITGLDPAQPGFQGFPKMVRLAKGDANFIDIIHSDAKPFIPLFGFGFMWNLGDIDFYLNKGFGQPNCIEFPPIKDAKGLQVLKKLTVEVISNAVGCSHGRSYLIFTAAINPNITCPFVGRKIVTTFPMITSTTCGNETCPEIGLKTPSFTARGAYQVRTSGKAPYCCEKYSPIFGCSMDTSLKSKIRNMNPFR